MTELAQNRQQSRYFATAAKMDDALLALLEKKDFAYITVKEICAAAGVNRSTFYLHYETIGDLLDEAVERINEQFLDYMDKDAEAIVGRLRTCPVGELYLVTSEYLEPYLTYVREHRRLFATAMDKAGVLGLDGTYNKMARHVFGPILDRLGVPRADRPYLMRFYISGLMAIISEWLEGGCEDSIEHVVAIIQRCVVKPGERK